MLKIHDSTPSFFPLIQSGDESWFDICIAQKKIKYIHSYMCVYLCIRIKVIASHEVK